MLNAIRDAPESMRLQLIRMEKISNFDVKSFTPRLDLKNGEETMRAIIF